MFIEFAIPIDLSKIQDVSGEFISENKITLKPSVLYNKLRRDLERTDIFPVKTCDMPELYISAGFFNALLLGDIVGKASWNQKFWHLASNVHNIMPFEKMKNIVQSWSSFNIRSVVSLYHEVGIVSSSGLVYLAPSVDIDNFNIRYAGSAKGSVAIQNEKRREAIIEAREIVMKKNINNYKERGFSCG